MAAKSKGTIEDTMIAAEETKEINLSAEASDKLVESENSPAEENLGNDAKAALTRPKRTFKRWCMDALRAMKGSLGYTIIAVVSVGLLVYMIISDFLV